MTILIIGGSGSGKSEYAEKRILQAMKSQKAIDCGRTEARGEMYYLATMQPFGEEGARRINRHIRLRAGKGFTTLERTEVFSDLAFDENDGVLLEDVMNFTANVMYSENSELKGASEEILIRFIVQEILSIKGKCKELVMVTGDVVSDGILHDEETETYKRIITNVNRELAAASDEVVEVVAGLPDIIKK